MIPRTRAHRSGRLRVHGMHGPRIDRGRDHLPGLARETQRIRCRRREASVDNTSQRRRKGESGGVDGKSRGGPQRPDFQKGPMAGRKRYYGRRSGGGPMQAQQRCSRPIAALIASLPGRCEVRSTRYAYSVVRSPYSVPSSSTAAAACRRRRRRGCRRLDVTAVVGQRARAITRSCGAGTLEFDP